MGKLKLKADQYHLVQFVLITLLFFVASSLEVDAKTHYQTLHILWTPITRLCETEYALTVNGQIPGPTLYVNKGDTMIITLLNHSPENITVHWHGLKQPRNPWSDGPEYITQCSIPSGRNFTYTLYFSVEEGTIWYHGHSMWTRATVHGAIVVYPEEGSSYPFPTPDEEFPVVIGEWWTAGVRSMVEEALSTGAEFHPSDAITINGQPGDLYNCSSNATTRFAVEKGKTYLLRLINAGMSNPYYMALANHTFTIVGRDGAYLKPFNASILAMGPGQTMDVLVEANQDDGLYYFAIRTYSDAPAVGYDSTTSTAVFEYYGSNDTTQVAPYLPELPGYNDTNTISEFTARFRGLNTSEGVPKEVDHKFAFVVSLNWLSCVNASCGAWEGGMLISSINNVSWKNPFIDVLQAYYNNITDVYETDFPTHPLVMYNFTSDTFSMEYLPTSTGTKVIVLEYNATVEIVFQTTSLMGGENHPMHLHGHSFYQVGSGSGNFDNETDPATYNLDDPPFINTVGVPYRGWTAIRFRASNPGVWLLHCHLSRHQTWGMVGVFIVKDGPTEDTKMLAKPQGMPNFCPPKLKSDI